MSIFPQTATMLLREHKHRPISGDVVLIGRQTVLLTLDEALALIKSEGVEPRANFIQEEDTTTVGSNVGHYITDRAFFSMFCDARTIALDVSSYEGAEIVHDLNVPLPENLRHVADFIFNGSCLDNLFDPAGAIKSMSKMLRPGGRVVHLEHGSPVQDAFLCYSPEWFFDFYAVNNYADCQIYVCMFNDGYMRFDWKLARWVPYSEHSDKLLPNPASLGVGHFINFVVAEKGIHSTDELTPIQSHYRSFHEDPTADVYRNCFLKFSQSKRIGPAATGNEALVPIRSLKGKYERLAKLRVRLAKFRVLRRLRRAYRALTS